LATRDFSRAGETFIDHQGQLNEILYSILTSLDYHAYVSVGRLRHIEKHPIASRHKDDLPPRRIQMEKMEIRLAGEVIEFIFGPIPRLMFGDEGQPGLEVGRNRKNCRVVAYMCYCFPLLYHRILKGLKEKPIPGRFSVETVDEGDQVTPICDPRVKNAAFPEIVQWVWEKYYAHLEATPVKESTAAKTPTQTSVYQ
jgi:hypothetical protein